MQTQDPGLAMVPYGVVPEGWTAHWYAPGGVRKALLVSCGTEVHFEIDPAHRRRLLSKKTLREILQPVMEKFGYLTTKIPVECEEDLKFVERVGFQKTWTDGEFEYLMLTRYPFEKELSK